MRKLWQRIIRFFLFSSDAPLWLKLMPYIAMGVLTLLVVTGGVFAWDYTNSNSFCGTSCHTMPPQYSTYLRSPHARVDCVECHLGRDTIHSQIPRKFEHSHTLIALITNSYEFPIVAKKMRPATDACETCHYPEKFSSDSVREIKTYASDDGNTPSSTMLVMKIGGGSQRQGLGRGIHWHIENDIEFYATDQLQQNIPYVKVTDQDGKTKEYFDVASEMTPDQLKGQKLVRMDCITCHNRIAHSIPNPPDAIDEAITQKLIPADLPDVKKLAVEALKTEYKDTPTAMQALAGFEDNYAKTYPDVYSQRKDDVHKTALALQEIYTHLRYPEQELDWNSHPNNVGHKNSPGCFRCHDGKHLSTTGESVRLECNICHSVPVVTSPKNLVSNIEISRGPEPSSHTNTNWISLHGKAKDTSCATCHKPKDPSIDLATIQGQPPLDGSFCGNSACHGPDWKFTGFKSPALTQVLQDQLAEIVKATTPQPVAADAPKTYEGAIKGIFEGKCISCHAGDAAMAGLDLTTYQNVLKGGQDGPGITPGDPEKSTIYKKQSAGGHYGQMEPDEIALLKDWITAGAPEK